MQLIQNNLWFYVCQLIQLNDSIFINKNFDFSIIFGIITCLTQ